MLRKERCKRRYKDITGHLADVSPKTKKTVTAGILECLRTPYRR